MRTACFTSTAPGEDLVRLAVEQEAELLVAEAQSPAVLETLSAAPCDVAIASRGLHFEPDHAVLVPFGGAREEWAALELAAWIARAHGLRLRLLGTEASETRRDASRMLAGASLALQRFAGIAAEPVILPPGFDGVRLGPASLVVASLPAGELDPTRRALVESLPALLVRGGLRPGGLAPDQTLTRFSWSLAEPSS